MKKIFNMIKRFSLLGKVALAIIILIMILGVFSKIIAVHPHDFPSDKSLEAPNINHWLGTDDLGIDLWAQICYGARVSIIVGFTTSILAGIGGGIIGIISGYWGGNADRVIMRITDMIIILPDLALMIVLGAFFGPSLRNIILVLAIFSWTHPARIVRSKIISIKQENHIRIAQSYGAGIIHLILWHFIPSVGPLIMVSGIRLMSRAIVAEAGLAFLGLGDPTSKSWGLILNHAINFKGIYFTEYWKWWVVSPLIAIIMIVFAIAFIYRDLERLIIHKRI